MQLTPVLAILPEIRLISFPELGGQYSVSPHRRYADGSRKDEVKKS